MRPKENSSDNNQPGVIVGAAEHVVDSIFAVDARVGRVWPVWCLKPSCAGLLPILGSSAGMRWRFSLALKLGIAPTIYQQMVAEKYQQMVA